MGFSMLKGFRPQDFFVKNLGAIKKPKPIRFLDDPFDSLMNNNSENEVED
jgi:hypothetical protein